MNLRLSLIAAALALTAAPASAQVYMTQPLEYGHPENGSITITPQGTYRTVPLDYDHPGNGSLTFAPNGSPSVPPVPPYGVISGQTSDD